MIDWEPGNLQGGKELRAEGGEGVAEAVNSQTRVNERKTGTVNRIKNSFGSLIKNPWIGLSEI